jgi:hypothetical protein
MSDAGLADLMYCGNKLVNLGDSKFEVLQKCGEPTYKDENRWIYDQGTGEFRKIVIFAGDKVAVINEGERQEWIIWDLIVDGKSIQRDLKDISPGLAAAKEEEQQQLEVSPSGYGIHCVSR